MKALSAISSLSLLLVQTQAARWKAGAPQQLTSARLYLDIARSGYLFHGSSGDMVIEINGIHFVKSCHNISPCFPTKGDKNQLVWYKHLQTLNDTNIC